MGEISVNLEEGAGRPNNNSPPVAENYYKATKSSILHSVGISTQQASKTERIAIIS